MNQLLNWLDGGDLTSDGDATQVANLVSENIELLPDLIEGLHAEDDLIRGRAADALEKIARQHPEPTAQYIDLLLHSAEHDSVPMARWHLVMTLGHISMLAEHSSQITATLLRMLDDQSVFVQSWSIVSLCIIARQYPETIERIAPAIASMGDSPSKAIQAKVRYALPLLTDPQAPMPKGWVKSQHLQNL